MENATVFFNLLYTRFILRDLFGKIVPGTLILVSILLFFNWPIKLELIAQLSFWGWLTVSGVAWIIGFAIQSIGEFVLGNLSWGYRYYPKSIFKDGKKEILNDEKWYKIYFKLFPKDSIGYEDVNGQVERLVVIKEACGNGFVTSFIILFLYWFNLGKVIFDALSIILLLISLALWRIHIRHVHRQFKAIQSILELRETKT